MVTQSGTSNTEESTTTSETLAVKNENTGAEYKSIQTAIDEATKGDTILLREGVHVEGHIILVDKPLTLRGETGTYVAWDGGTGEFGDIPHSNEVVDQAVFLVRTNNVTFENLVIDGLSHHKSEQGYSENVNETSYGIAVMDGDTRYSHLTIRNVEVRNTILEGIHLFRMDGVTLDGVRSTVKTPQSINVNRTSAGPPSPAPPLPSYPTTTTTTSSQNIAPTLDVNFNTTGDSTTVTIGITDWGDATALGITIENGGQPRLLRKKDGDKFTLDNVNTGSRVYIRAFYDDGSEELLGEWTIENE